TLGAIPGWARSTPPLRALVFDLSGHAVNPFRTKRSSATVLIFIRTDCPISNRYAPEIQRIEAEFIPRGVVFWLIDPDPTESATVLRQHLKQYRYEDTIHVLRDPTHTLVGETGVTVTPEVAVFSDAGEMLYRGRIDNWYVRLGRYRPTPTTHDLDAALAAILAGKPVSRKTTPAFGCFIADMQ
ncbi:MAG: redoxin domain-containing protein, partial [Terriglobia bacterium]